MARNGRNHRIQQPTDVELEVLRRIAKGETGRQIAEDLGYAPRTVQGYVESLSAKWCLRNSRILLVSEGFKRGYLTAEATTRETSCHGVMSAKSARAIRRNYAFIAMAMDPDDPQLEDVFDAIKDASEQCGVKAERIDDEPSNRPIINRILTSIGEAEFIIVDISNVRANVFYEAGYASGLGKTPIYLARKGTEIPFDLKDYPIILYQNMRELKMELTKRLRGMLCNQRTSS